MANITEFEKQCYGMSEAGIRREYMEGLTARLSGLEMVCMSILSDAQELMAMGKPEAARKEINRAKCSLSEMMDAKQTA